MGCFGSRFDKRAGAVNHFTSGLQFVGGEAHEHNGSPVDHFVFSVQKEVESKKVPAELQEQFPTAEGKATDETITTAVYTATFNAVTALKAELEKGKSEKDDVIGGRYKRSAAIAQLEAVLVGFATSGIEIKAAEEPKKEGEEDKKEEEKKDEPVAEGAEGGEEDLQYDGGDGEGDAAADAEKPVEGDAEKPPVVAAMDPGVYDADDFSYAGWEAVPAIFLKQATVNTYWGDLVKGNIIHWEFNQKKASDHTWSGAAGFISSFLATSARADTETWFSGFVGEDDLASLTAIAKDGPILFPGWIAGWKTEADAIAHIATLNKEDAKTALHPVVFHVTGASALAFAQCRLFSHRLEGKVASNAKKDDNTHFEVTGSPHNDQTIAEWVAAAAAKAAEGTTPPVVPAPEGDAKPEDGAKVEGDGMEPAAAPEE